MDMPAAPTIQRPDAATMRANLTRFKHDWRQRLGAWGEANQGAIEKKYAQSFWSELLAAFGITATRFDLFEQDARRASSGQGGYIDLFWPGVVIGEAKSPRKDLDAAVAQARDYLQGGSVSNTEQPNYIIASDFETFRLIRLGAPEQRYDITFPLSEVDDHVDQLKFFAGYEDVTPEEQEAASIRASRLMADLFTAMVGDDADEEVGDDAPTNPEDEDAAVQETSMYLTRLLFLLFGDDAGLWEQDLFYRFVLDHTPPETLGSQLAALFDVLNTPEEARSKRLPDALARFPYVNGSIFAETMPMQYFSPAMRDALINACRFQWTHISPAIFGSMFQLVKSREARRGDGEHYTSEKNILKTIGPLFLDEMRAEADRLIAAKSTPTAKLRQFRDSLATHLFCDPACGSGNFLVVAYRELRRIETDLIVAIRQREGETGMALDATWEQKLSIGQFHGFELNWWPARIAETAMFLVDHQENRHLADRVGQAPDRLPISITAHIHHGNALRTDWATTLPMVEGMTFLFGNPPYAGHKERSNEQGKDLKAAWGTNAVGHVDFVTAWVAKALNLFEERKGSFAYVMTNSVVQGESVHFVFAKVFAAGWRIRFAFQPFVWDSEAPGKAAVHCVIVGFERDRTFDPLLFDPQTRIIQSGGTISPYLIPGIPATPVRPRRSVLSPSLGQIRAGSTPIDWDNLVVTEEQYSEVVGDPIAAKYLRLYLGGHEVINGAERWCLWLAGPDFNPDDIERSSILKRRVSAVERKRAESKRAATNKASRTPHLFGEIRQPDTEYLGIPQSFAEGRRFATVDLLSPEVIASVKLFTIDDPTGFYFGLLSSSMFITWQKTVGGRIKSDPSLSSSLVWNTLPLPKLEQKQIDQIIKGGRKVREARNSLPGRTLAQLYKPLAMDPALVKAHDALDREVDLAFGAPRKLTTERQRQEVLFARYTELTAAR